MIVPDLIGNLVNQTFRILLDPRLRGNDGQWPHGVSKKDYSVLASSLRMSASSSLVISPLA